MAVYKDKEGNSKVGPSRAIGPSEFKPRYSQFPQRTEVNGLPRPLARFLLSSTKSSLLTNKLIGGSNEQPHHKFKIYAVKKKTHPEDEYFKKICKAIRLVLQL